MLLFWYINLIKLEKFWLSKILGMTYNLKWMEYKKSDPKASPSSLFYLPRYLSLSIRHLCQAIPTRHLPPVCCPHPSCVLSPPLPAPLHPRDLHSRPACPLPPLCSSPCWSWDHRWDQEGQRRGKEGDDEWDPCVSVWMERVEGNRESVGVNNLVWREIFLESQMRVFFKKRVKLELNGEIKLANFFEMLCVAVFLVFYHPPLHVSFVATCDLWQSSKPGVVFPKCTRDQTPWWFKWCRRMCLTNTMSCVCEQTGMRLTLYLAMWIMVALFFHNIFVWYFLWSKL